MDFRLSSPEQPAPGGLHNTGNLLALFGCITVHCIVTNQHQSVPSAMGEYLFGALGSACLLLAMITSFISADYCPNAVISYDFPALSMQFHPEYPNQFIEDVIDVFDDSGIMGGNTDDARASIKKDMRSALFGKQAADFYRGNFPSS